jgi:REP element-mobilizing transposase RayT
MKKIDGGAGAPPRRKENLRPEVGPSPDEACRNLHLAQVSPFRDNPIVFFTACTGKRWKLLACSQCHEILREIWERSAEHDGWWVGHYILMPDHVHFFARPEIDARPMAAWVQMWKSVSSRRIAAALVIGQPIWQAEYFDRYLRSFDGKLFGEVELRRTKRSAGGASGDCRGVAVLRNNK